MEILSHIPLFKQIFRTILKEEFNDEIPDNVKQQMIKMIRDMAETEKRWTKYVTEGLLGFTDRTIDIYIEGCANDVCSNLKLDKIYPTADTDPLKSLLKKKLKGDELESRTNFFEANATEYSKGTIELDY